MNGKAFYNLAEVRKMLDISERTILHYLKKGELTGVKVGREWRFTQVDIDSFIELRRRKTEEEMRQKRKTEPRLPSVNPTPEAA